MGGSRDRARSGLQDVLAKPRRVRSAAQLRLVAVDERRGGRPAVAHAGSPGGRRRRVLRLLRWGAGGGFSAGSVGGVFLRGRVPPPTPKKPARLALTIDYGVCKDICIPAQ